MGAKRKAGVVLKSDERILGSSEFVHATLAEAKECFERRYALAAKRVSIGELVTAVSELLDLEPSDLVGPSKVRTIVKARILICYWAVKDLGMSMTSIASKLGISVPTVSVAAKKGQKLVRQEGLKIAEILNVKI